ncbi:MAG: hypothetical protein AAFQ80_23090 [Cyanobacteria bacterium J06621_8]
MELTNDTITRELPLSHTIYKDNEIDASKAEQLTVYHYPLTKSYKWKEWQSHLDSELSERHHDSERYYPYLMKSYRGQFGLFVALDSPDDQPPVIKNSDGVEIAPEKVSYAPEMNPIWIRLIMRKILAFGSHCRGSHTLGRPLLKIDVWKGKKSTGINAISLDCRTQQLADKNTTEIILFYENVPLRPLGKEEDISKQRSSLWVYDKNKVLVRWIPTRGQKPAGVVYKEIPKSRNKRKQRPFLDLSSEKTFKASWPCILKPIQDELINRAQDFGFKLEPKILKLKPLKPKTKSKSNPLTRNSFSSMALDNKVDVLDLRMAQKVPGTVIVQRIQQALNKKKLGTQLTLLLDIELDDIDKLEFAKNQRVLVLLDQLKGVVGDRYPLTQILRTKVACQHINVNPNDLLGDSVEKNLLVEQDDDNGNSYLIPEADSKYYGYNVAQFDEEKCVKALSRNAEIVIKELELKHLLLNSEAKISTCFPKQELLTENLIVITDGYLFTVKNDRPIILPFNPANTNQVRDCDGVLGSFDTSVRSLLNLLMEKWPYSYRPEVVMQGFGGQAEKLERFARRLTIVVYKSDAISIFLQDPKYDTPHMLPFNLDEAAQSLKSQNLKRTISSWQLPEMDKLKLYIEQLVEEKELNKSKEEKLLLSLDSLVNCWNNSLKELIQNGSAKVDYNQLKKSTLKSFLKVQNAKLKPGETPRTSNHYTRLVYSWTKLLSRAFELPLNDARGWLRNIPGITRLWHDPEEGYYVVGALAPLKKQIQRQPSIRQWHALEGELDTELLTELVDVDWVRTNQLAGNPCVATLVKRWRECQSEPNEALKA